MKLLKFVSLFSVAISLSACSSLYLPKQTAQTDEQIAQRRAEIRAMEMQDYRDERKQRQDAIEDLGTLEMNRAKAINKAYENRSKQKIYILH
ncbi:aerial mycelium formation protein [Muribacter muris]|uniref:Aerial mycelium formation protein n=1 Tax=Muribacter muris TaxID=67855 RepID=A0A4Y9JT70_9PAST|nr:aerial mycelium formation protein [Muribacter muris]MBF0785689.1 aerial mycelium formation protein [Muribacter muris]MBF0827724.1 aerial mycelium formation protein [Muribacter muris]TFV08768.1 aerial mycelium formation protein [Muribacter muris]